MYLRRFSIASILVAAAAITACGSSSTSSSRNQGIAEGATTGDPSSPDGGAGAIAVDPFDDSLSHGAPLSASDARSLFAAGTSKATLGGFAMAQRTRACNVTTGCGSWVRNDSVTFAYSAYELWSPGPGWSQQRGCTQFKSETFASIEGAMALDVDANGRIALMLSSAVTGDVHCGDVTAGPASCGPLSTADANPTGGRPCNLPNPGGTAVDGTVYPSTVTLFDETKHDGSPLAMQVIVTRDYVYGRASTKSAPDAAGTSREVEYALYGTVRAGSKPTFTGGESACRPTACDAQGKNCGTIDDGCGGKISCGGCNSPYHCGGDNTCQVPPDCNLQQCPNGGGQTCCSAGRMTCPGTRTCDCFDACN